MKRIGRFMAVITLIFTLIVLTACGNNSSVNSGGTTTGEQGSQGSQGSQSSQETKGGEDEGRVLLIAASAPSSSPYYAYVTGISSAVKEFKSNYSVTVQDTNGAVDASRLRLRGDANFSMTTTDIEYDIKHGTGPFEGNASEDSRVLWYMGTLPAHWFVTEQSGINSLAELAGKDFGGGGTGAAIETLTKTAFELMGIEPNYFAGSQADAATAITDRRIIGTTKGGSPPDAYIQQIDAQIHIKLLGLTEEEVKLIADNTTYVPFTIPAGSYRGQDEDILTVTSLVGMAATPALSQEIGYNLVKAKMDGPGRSTWESAFPAAAGIDILELTLSSRNMLHAGMVQYLQENGYDVPDSMIPPEYKQ